MIGISSLIVVTSVMNGFEKELEDRILGVIPHSVITSDDAIKDYKNLITEIKENENVIDAAPYINIQGIISSSYDTRGISIVGIDTEVEKKYVYHS
jgi:lipoprotein-releasing system permease protein